LTDGEDKFARKILDILRATNQEIPPELEYKARSYRGKPNQRR